MIKTAKTQDLAPSPQITGKPSERELCNFSVPPFLSGLLSYTRRYLISASALITSLQATYSISLLEGQNLCSVVSLLTRSLSQVLPNVIRPLMISGDFFISLIAATGSPQLATGPQKCCKEGKGK